MLCVVVDDCVPDAAAERQLRALGAVADADIGQLDVNDLLRELLARVTELLDADTAAVFLLDERTGQLVARAAHGVEEEVRRGVRIPVGKGFAGRIAAERRPGALERVDATTVANPLLWEKGIRSMLGVPLLAGPRLVGVLHVGTATPRRFEERDVQLLQLAAERVATAVQRRELELERATARVLQRSLIPTALPDCPGVELASRYVTAERGGVGGDWYDVIVLEHGVLWITVGDVVGHGLEASVVMGRLRSTLRAYALEASEPEDVLERTDRKLQHFEPDGFATVLCGRAEAPYDTIRLASAGHLLPALIGPGASHAAPVEIPVGLPLGVASGVTRVGADVALPPGALLVAFTDGLVERAGEPIDAGLARLCAALRLEDPEAACSRLMEALVDDEAPRDDIAVLALRRACATPEPCDRAR